MQLMWVCTRSRGLNFGSGQGTQGPETELPVPALSSRGSWTQPIRQPPRSLDAPPSSRTLPCNRGCEALSNRLTPLSFYTAGSPRQEKRPDCPGTLPRPQSRAAGCPPRPASGRQSDPEAQHPSSARARSTTGVRQRPLYPYNSWSRLSAGRPPDRSRPSDYRQCGGARSTRTTLPAQGGPPKGHPSVPSVAPAVAGEQVRGTRLPEPPVGVSRGLGQHCGPVLGPQLLLAAPGVQAGVVPPPSACRP